MKKLALVLALLLTFGGVSFADIQIDEGQLKSTAAKVFFVGRNARTSADSTSATTDSPGVISKDSIVVWDSTSKDGVTITTATASSDRLAVGIALDDILGSSTDSTAAEDDSSGNWGRVQTWGLYLNVRKSPDEEFAIGEPVCTSNDEGDAQACLASGDGIGVAISTETKAATTVDVMLM
jgi:hypothetical protein